MVGVEISFDVSKGVNSLSVKDGMFLSTVVLTDMPTVC